MGSNYLFNSMAMWNGFNGAMNDNNFQVSASEARLNCGHCNDGGVIMMDGLSDALGMYLGSLEPENRYLAYGLGAAAIVVTRNPSIARAEFGAEKAATYSVYQGIENGAVKYVGITKRAPSLRWAEHAAAGGPKSFLDFRVVEGAQGLTRAQARTLEQNLINQHGLPNLYNQINSIAPKNWWQYVEGDSKKNQERLTSAILTRDGSYILAGTSAEELGKENWKIVKLKDPQVEDLMDNRNIQIYPNPVGSYCYVEIGADFTEADLYIYDMTGRLVQQTKTKNKITKLNTTSLPQGSYVIKAQTNNQQKLNLATKIIKE